MDNIWSIIGLSSLIASVVTVILGIVRDILVEKHRFKRQSEAGYLQSQIRLYAQTHFLLKRFTLGAVTSMFFETVPEPIKGINKIIETSSDFIAPEFMNKWLAIMTLIENAKKTKDKKQQTQLLWEADEKMKQLILIIEEIANNILIPKYRKIVGKTVPSLE